MSIIFCKDSHYDQYHKNIKIDKTYLPHEQICVKAIDDIPANIIIYKGSPLIIGDNIDISGDEFGKNVVKEIFSKFDHKTIEMMESLFPRTKDDIINFIGDKLQTIINNNIENIKISDLSDIHLNMILSQLKIIFNIFKRDKIYLLIGASKFNHSCFPNCFISVHNGICYISTLMNIKSGDELTLSYNTDDHHLLANNPKYRQICLQKQFNFKCQCLACIKPTILDLTRQFYIRINKLESNICNNCGNIIDAGIEFCNNICEKEYQEIFH